MSCRSFRRELVELARHGELDPRSGPHIEHLVACRACRDEIGFDRALVQQLRIALAERVESALPPADAWSVILARAQAPETGAMGWLRGHAVIFAARLRVATAAAGAALALVVATGTQVAITQPTSLPAQSLHVQSAAAERFERSPLIPRSRAEFIEILGHRSPVAYVPSALPRDPELAFLVNASGRSAMTSIGEPAPEEHARSRAPGSSLTGPTPADAPPARARSAADDAVPVLAIPARAPS